MTVKQRVRHAIQRLGFDLVRYPLHSPLARTIQLFEHHRVDCVIDIGANDGGFASDIRSLGYAGRIVSIEPLRTPFEALRHKACRDPRWDTVNCAVGESPGEVLINVSGNRGLSSSVLPMLDAHIDAAPRSRYCDNETVRQERLDDLFPGFHIGSSQHTFLKIDVQGYEREVLAGARQTLKDPRVVGLQLEISLVPLYKGAMTYREALDSADALGMTLMGLDPVFIDPDSGRLLQVDAVFFRS